MSLQTDIKRLGADLNRWRAAFPGKTPEEARASNAGPLLKWLDEHILEDEGAMIYARDSGEWDRYHRLEGNKDALISVKAAVNLIEKSTALFSRSNIKEIDQLKRERDEVQKCLDEYTKKHAHCYQELLKAEAAVAAVKVCGMCNGRGYDHGPGEGEISRCPTCDGQGTIRDYHSPTEWDELQKRCAAFKKIIELHHAWHLEAPKVYFYEDGKPCEIVTDLAEAYVESDLCEKTLPAFKDDTGKDYIALRFIRCPSCGFTTIRVSNNGDPVCSWMECKDPTAINHPERYISRADAEAETLQKVKPLVEALQSLSPEHWAQQNRVIEALAHARTHFPKAFE